MARKILSTLAVAHATVLLGVSIKTRTTLAFALFALLCAGTTGALLSSMARHGLEEVILDRQRLFAMQGAIALLDDIQLATEELEHISRMVEVDLDDTDDAPERRVLNEAWRLTLFFFDGSVLLVDETGRCHGAEPRDAGCAESYADEPWFLEGIAAPRPVVHFGPNRDSPLALVVPMRDDTGALEGLLRGEIRLERGDFFDDSVYGAGPGTHDLVMVGEDGRELFVHGRPPLQSAAWRAAVESSSRAGAMVSAIDGERTVLAWAPIGETGARLVYAWPWLELDRASDERGRALAWAAGVIALVGVIVGFLVARRLTEPVLALEGEVLAARVGRAGIAAGGSRDEVGALRHAFAELVAELAAREESARADRDRVAELADTLEERVQRRTRELEATRDALIDAERLAALGRAGAALSHELRNALNALSVGMDVLGGTLSAEVRAKVRQQVLEEIGRLRTLADVLLDFARPRVLQRRPTTSKAVLARAHALVEDYASDHGVDVAICDDVPDLRLEVDTELLQSVLTNLLRNAIEAASSSESRRASARARLEDGAWILDVEDSGVGVSDEVRVRLFQPFSSGRVGGVGLGLALARRFVELHGGRLDEIGVSSLGGACFRVALPLRTLETPEDS